jgi:hypothetical protein
MNYKIIPSTQTHSYDLFLASVEEIKSAEDDLKIVFESDYKHHVMTYGNGILGGSFIHIYLPSQILTDIDAWKSRINEYWRLDNGKEVLTKAQVLKSVIVGDTLEGDEIIYFNDSYFILPKNFETIYKIGNTLTESIEWICSSGILVKAFEERNFEPFEKNKIIPNIFKFKNNKIYFWSSIYIYLISLTQTAYTTQYGEKVVDQISWELLLMGGTAFLGGGLLETIIWLANPLYFLALTFYFIDKKFCKKTIPGALILSINFLFWSKILGDESGYMSTITAHKLGYYLWTTSIIVLSIGIFSEQKIDTPKSNKFNS